MSRPLERIIAVWATPPAQRYLQFFVQKSAAGQGAAGFWRLPGGVTMHEKIDLHAQFGRWQPLPGLLYLHKKLHLST